MVSGRPYGEGLPLTLRPVQYTVAPASPSARAIPRPAPRVAPATRAVRPASGLWNDLLFAMVVSCLKLKRALSSVKVMHETRTVCRECGRTYRLGAPALRGGA